MTTSDVVAIVAALSVLGVLAIWLIPKAQARRWAADGIRGKELAELVVAARGTLVQIVAGVALILTFAATWMQIADARHAAELTQKLGQAQQETERFTRAVGQLGSNNLSLRLGGIYGLERVALDSPRSREPVVRLMLAYLHQFHPSPPNGWPSVGEAKLEWFKGQFGPCSSRLLKAPPDTQAAIDVLRRIKPDPSSLDLAELDLRGIQIEGANLSGADLRGTSLESARAEGANFTRAQLNRVDLTHACLQNASLRGSIANASRWPAADVRGADLSKMLRNGALFERLRADKCTRINRPVAASCRKKNQLTGS
jgi:hypothetical protein